MAQVGSRSPVGWGNAQGWQEVWSSLPGLAGLVEAPVAPYSTEILLNPDLSILRDLTAAGWKYSLTAGSHFGGAIPARANSRSLVRKGAIYVKS